MTQLSFGTNRKLRDRAYELCVKNGEKARRFSLTGQILHGSYVGTIYMLDYDPNGEMADSESVYEIILELSRQAESTLPRPPAHFGQYRM